MNLKVKLEKGTYLTNCVITKRIKSARESNANEDYDLVEIRCNNWRDVAKVWFNGKRAIPDKIREDGYIEWTVFKDIYNDQEYIIQDFNVIREQFRTLAVNASTYEAQEILEKTRRYFEKLAWALLPVRENKNE